MKNFLIFLSIVVVTVLAAIDLNQRIAELDNISDSLQMRKEIQDHAWKESDHSEKQSEINQQKAHK